MYDHGLIYLCLCTEVGLASVRRDLPFCLDHMVVGQPHCMMEVCSSAPPRQTKIAICALGRFWLGA